MYKNIRMYINCTDKNYAQLRKENECFNVTGLFTKKDLLFSIIFLIGQFTSYNTAYNRKESLNLVHGMYSI